MVQARTRIMNQLQAVARNEGLRCKKIENQVLVDVAGEIFSERVG